MKAVIFSQFGVPWEVAEVVERPDPDPPGEGEVLIAVEAVPINPADLLTLSGDYGAEPPPLPMTPGAEGVGKVVEVGAGVDNVKPGDRVILPGRGNWRTHVTGPARGLVALPPAADPLQLAMLRVNPPTALLMLRDFVDLEAGDWVIQDAANSAVGRHVVRLANRRGIKTINVVRRPDLIAELTAIGADLVLVDGADVVEKARAATDGKGAKLAIDAVGGRTTMQLAAALADGATVVNYGLLSGEPCMIDAKQTVFHDIRLRGFWLAKWFAVTAPADIAAVYAELGGLVASGALHVPVEATYPLAEAKAAIRHAAREARAGKVLMTMN